MASRGIHVNEERTVHIDDYDLPPLGSGKDARQTDEVRLCSSGSSQRASSVCYSNLSDTYLLRLPYLVQISLEGWEIEKESQADLVRHRV
jgi:hypothetical protein